MKKLLSVLLTAVLTLSFATVSFSAATPDEAKTVTSIEMTQLPDKTEYLFDMVEAGWDDSNANGYLDITVWDNLLEELEKAVFFINVDLTGAVITATYSDGSTEVIDNDLCTTSVADPVSLRAFFEAFENMETEEDAYVIYEMLIREYTINVEYAGATTSFNVSLTYEDYSYEEIYEFVSYTNPDTDNYEVIYDEEIGFYWLEFDLTGMTVTVKNTETGELKTYGEEDIYIDFWYDEADIPAPGEQIAEGMVFTESGEVVYFDYPFTLKGEETDTPEESKPAPKPDTDKDAQSSTKPASTADTATKDTVNNKPDNNAIQTGNPVTAILLVVVMLSATAVAFVFYRKKAK